MELAETMGSVVNYDIFYLELFKLLNFGIIVALLIRIFE